MMDQDCVVMDVVSQSHAEKFGIKVADKLVRIGPDFR